MIKRSLTAAVFGVVAPVVVALSCGGALAQQTIDAKRIAVDLIYSQSVRFAADIGAGSA